MYCTYHSPVRKYDNHGHNHGHTHGHNHSHARSVPGIRKGNAWHRRDALAGSGAAQAPLRRSISAGQTSPCPQSVKRGSTYPAILVFGPVSAKFSAFPSSPGMLDILKFHSLLGGHLAERKISPLGCMALLRNVSSLRRLCNIDPLRSVKNVPYCPTFLLYNPLLRCSYHFS